MRITIAQRLRPYSHRPGTQLILPGSGKSVSVYPARLILSGVGEVALGVTGPVKDFTTCLDLEHGRIQVWGHAANGYFRYVLAATTSHQVVLHLEKAPENGLSLAWNARNVVLQVGESFDFHNQPTNDAVLYAPVDTERLSFGSHKALNWEQVAPRHDMADILPVWFRLGRLLKCQDPIKGSGTTYFLTQENGQLIDLFKAGFSGLLHPQLTDTLHQGYALPEPVSGENPLNLLTAGSKAIRDLFVRDQEREVYLLPSLPTELHCGRFINVACGGSSTLDLEWSKKLARRVIFKCGESGSWLFHFQKQLTSFRLKYAEVNNDRGRWIDCGTPLEYLAGRTYTLDNFQKK